jgi:GalNAc-alpha-(1->4)-GalNAc-alpha-(1->3)-diNAcBac-PP-undecaprenol alpha-1,4-N-acetyl-D-galactosaminyltransferase
MKMTLVISSLNAGGAERVMTTLANAWAAAGDDVSLITFETPHYQPFYALSASVKLHNLDLLNRSVCNPLVKIWKLLRRFWVLRQAFKSEKPDCIISFIDTVNIVTILTTVGLNIPVIISERVDPQYHSIGVFKNFLRKITYPFADHIVVQTKQIQHYFPKKLHSRISIVSNPVSEPPGDLSQTTIDFEQKKIIAIGRLEPQKGFDLLLQAFAVLHHEYPEWTLVIWGEGADRIALEALRDCLGLKTHVQFPGLTNNVYQVLSAGSLFVLSSRYEGFPNSLCEAMATGLPVVAFDCGSGPVDIIRHEIDGLLVPAQNINALADAMSQLVQSIELRKQYGNRAKEIVDRFSLKKVLEQWNVVRSAVDSPEYLTT